MINCPLIIVGLCSPYFVLKLPPTQLRAVPLNRRRREGSFSLYRTAASSGIGESAGSADPNLELVAMDLRLDLHMDP